MLYIIKSIGHFLGQFFLFYIDLFFFHCLFYSIWKNFIYYFYLIIVCCIGTGGLGVWFLFDVEEITSSNLVRSICHGSSDGRTPDWRSGCRWFKSGPWHSIFNIFSLFFKRSLYVFWWIRLKIVMVFNLIFFG